jgi:predicted amidophosphoribosyltransferase
MASPLKYCPQRLRGPWLEGYALDFHTVSSNWIGYDEFDQPLLDTRRTPLGEALYQLKYRSNASYLDQIVGTITAFLRARNWNIDLIIPMPPSNPRRSSQPVIEIARRLGQNLRFPVCGHCVQKVKSTPLKNVHDPNQRAQLLSGAFRANAAFTSGERLLLIDDLSRSGATAVEVARTLLDNGNAEALYFIAITKTRKHG